MRFALLSGALMALVSVPAAQTSKNCQLLSRITHAGTGSYAGVWGYRDAATGREFAVVGASNGTWIVETTNPTSPVEKGFIPGPSSQWRELSSYGQHLYAVTEGGGGVQIISMVNPDSPILVNTYTQTFWFNTHSVSVDQTAGKLYCNGTLFAGMRVFDLVQDPTNPVPVTTWTTAYVHDAFIQNGYAYLSCINAGQLRIMDVTALPTLTQLSATRTPGSFTHNAWADSTDSLCITSDEIPSGFLQVYDVTNKRLPVAKGRYSVAGAGIHNVFLVDDKVAHCSWYAAGYRAVDLTDPSQPAEIGYYDTANAWGCYPFQPSGTIYVSDIPSSGGLYCVRLTCGVPQRYGRGTGGSGGIVPRIDWSGGYARVGNATFRVEGEQLLGGAAAVLVLGGAQASVPVLGIDLLVDLAQPHVIISTAASGSGAGGGSAGVTVAIPNQPQLANQSVYAQWIVSDAGGPAGLAATQGSKITICP